MVITARPASHTSASGLQVVLTLLYHHDSLASFCLSVMGEFTQTYSVSELRAWIKMILVLIIVRIIGANFNFSRHTLSSG